MIRIKRIYEEPEESDGLRILVDRLWPRGVNREKGRIHLWLKEIAPSTELRKWYNHDPARWEAFKERYFAELDANRGAVTELSACLEKGSATLLFSSKELERNNAVALKEYLEKRLLPRAA